MYTIWFRTWWNIGGLCWKWGGTTLDACSGHIPVLPFAGVCVMLDSVCARFSGVPLNNERCWTRGGTKLALGYPWSIIPGAGGKTLCGPVLVGSVVFTDREGSVGGLMCCDSRFRGKLERGCVCVGHIAVLPFAGVCGMPERGCARFARVSLTNERCWTVGGTKLALEYPWSIIPGAWREKPSGRVDGSG